MELKHIIGRAVSPFLGVVNNFLSQTTKNTYDATVPDYEWWDKFRHGRQQGFELSGPQAHSLVEVLASWVLGRGVGVSLVEEKDMRMKKKEEYTNDLLRRFFASMQGELSTMYEDLLDLGDQYAHVDISGEVTFLRPDTVRLVPSVEDANLVDHVVVVNRSDDLVIEESFYPDRRERRVKKLKRPTGAKASPIKFVLDRTGNSSTNFVESPEMVDVGANVFPNPLGRIPIVHFAFNKGRNELYGRPLFENLRQKVLSEFDDVANKTFKGAKLMGTPVPTVSGLLNPEDFTTSSKTQEDDTYLDKDGNEETRTQIRWDEDSMFVIGQGGEFNFKSPSVGFSHDTIAVLEQLRRFMRDRTHVPPHMWGGTDTKKEAAEAQVDPWVRIVEGLRDKLAGRASDDKLDYVAKDGLYELAELFLMSRALVDKKVLVAPTVLQWADLAKEDKVVMFDMIKWAHSRGLLTNETALRLMDVVENVESEVEEAQLEQAARTTLATTDFGGVGNPVSNPPLTGDKTPDERAGNGADAPRMPAFAGGGS